MFNSPQTQGAVEHPLFNTVLPGKVVEVGPDGDDYVIQFVVPASEPGAEPVQWQERMRRKYIFSLHFCMMALRPFTSVPPMHMCLGPVGLWESVAYAGTWRQAHTAFAGAAQ